MGIHRQKQNQKIKSKNQIKIDVVYAVNLWMDFQKYEWVKRALRPRNVERLYMDEKSTEIGEVN